MKFQPIQTILKNGKTVTIQEATKKDAEPLLQTVSRYMADSEHLITGIEEFNPTVQDEKKWIETLNNTDNCVLLIAVHDRKIIGNIDLKGETRKKTKHNAVLGIGILNEWRNLGLGTILMECAIEWARQHRTLETLWLHVFASHTHAIRLYTKMGFEEACLQKDFVKYSDGYYIDNLVMRLDVKNA